MPRKKKKGWLRIPDCLRPSRKKFNFEDVDYDASVWDAPTLQPQDKRRIKYAWLVLHDGRLSHGEISEEFFSIVEEKFERLVGVYSSYTENNEDENSNAMTRQDELSSLRSGKHDERERRLAEKWVKLKNLKQGESPAFENCACTENLPACEVWSDLCPCVDKRSNDKLKCSRGDNKDNYSDDNVYYKEGYVRANAISPGGDVNDNNPGDHEETEEDVGDDNLLSVQEETMYVKNLEQQRDKSKQFRLHGLKILESFDRFVKLIDEHQTFMELGFEMRNFHRTFSGIQKAYYRIMFRCIEDTLVRVMDPKIYRKRIRESMIKFMELVYYNTTFQLDNAAVDEDYTTLLAED